ncbi:hypothetical protein [Amycolatopsis sp. H20-H5]|uniref:hypothetical protein n=1 Tax=Amycolatopsis sp. H20-H5 TaxID=3046309 RepID=UPI002DBD97A6|nr:hypothetical protein [Amycolatopsis sp. H20-H5]MEC3982179.1 hypothetical protein [Amycolatopsis sp. H20-H5]
MDYPHELRYQREQLLVYTEVVDDMGFVLETHRERKEAWLVRYTTGCAEDFLDRRCAKPGQYLVSVHRLSPERVHLVTVPLKKVGIHPSENALAERR